MMMSLEPFSHPEECRGSELIWW